MTKDQVHRLRTQLSDIYRDYRNVCLNQKYYAHRLLQAQRINQWYEIILAVGTSGAVAAWAVWQQPNWHVVWVVLGAIVAVFSIIKPIVNFSDRIQRLTTLETKFSALQIDFETLSFDIKTKRDLDGDLIKSYKQIREKFKTLGVREDSAPPLKLLRRLQAEVNRQVPASNLWSPK